LIRRDLLTHIFYNLIGELEFVMRVSLYCSPLFTIIADGYVGGLQNAKYTNKNSGLLLFIRWHTHLVRAVYKSLCIRVGAGILCVHPHISGVQSDGEGRVGRSE